MLPSAVGLGNSDANTAVFQKCWPFRVENLERNNMSAELLTVHVELSGSTCGR